MTHDIQLAKSNLPQPKKRMPEWGSDYLAALYETKGELIRAAKIVGKDYSTTYKARLNYPDLAQKVDEIKRECDSHNLAALEEVSMIQAMKPGNMTERFFNMKALDSKYRDHAIPTPPTINIVVGFTIGKDTPSFAGPTQVNDRIPEDYEVLEETKSVVRHKHLADNVLLDEDIDIDI